MGFFSNILGSETHDIAHEISEKQFEVSNCEFDCGSCNFNFPKSVKVQDASEGKLWNSTTPYDMHIVIPTGKTDWPSDALGTPGSFGNELQSWAKSVKFDRLKKPVIKVTVSSLSTPNMESDENHHKQTHSDLLLLPYFVWIRNICTTEFDLLYKIISNIMESNLDGTSPKLDYSSEYPDSDARVELDHSRSWIFLCSHRTRDKRCGVTAPIMKKEMDLYLRELGYSRDQGDDRADGVRVAFVNHIGGHKYAANVIIYLKNGRNIWLARCQPSNVKPIIDECVVQGNKIWPDYTRLIQKFNPVEW